MESTNSCCKKCTRNKTKLFRLCEEYGIKYKAKTNSSTFSNKSNMVNNRPQRNRNRKSLFNTHSKNNCNIIRNIENITKVYVKSIADILQGGNQNGDLAEDEDSQVETCTMGTLTFSMNEKKYMEHGTRNKGPVDILENIKIGKPEAINISRNISKKSELCYTNGKKEIIVPTPLKGDNSLVDNTIFKKPNNRPSKKSDYPLAQRSTSQAQQFSDADAEIPNTVTVQFRQTVLQNCKGKHRKIFGTDASEDSSVEMIFTQSPSDLIQLTNSSANPVRIESLCKKVDTWKRHGIPWLDDFHDNAMDIRAQSRDVDVVTASDTEMHANETNRWLSPMFSPIPKS